MEIRSWWNSSTPEAFSFIWTSDHLSQVNDEAVSFVEAGPGHFLLCGSDVVTAFHMQQSFDIVGIGHHMFETWSDSTFL